VLQPLVSRIGRTWRFGVPSGSPQAFLLAIACVATATGVTAAVDLFRPDILTHAAYYPATLFATLIGGAASGLFAMTLGAAIAWWIFKPPYLGLIAAEHTDLALYVVSSLIIIWAAQRYRRLVRKLDEEERYRRLVVEELGHRLKNKLANVYAIIGYELREHPQVWQKIDGRLRALARTDDLIAKSDRESANIRDILEAEFFPYGKERAKLEGETVHLPAKLAVTLALIFHELATNAAKYGALSRQSGRLRVAWTKAGSRMTIHWLETGGPAATPPRHEGFGQRLLERGLHPFHGEVDPRFGPEGFSATIVFSVPEDAAEDSRLPLAGSNPARAEAVPRSSALPIS
jgi:two-component sensor histidine kinase